MIRYLLFSILFLAVSGHASAQLLSTEMGPDSTKNAFIPVFSYSSDIGFAGGAVFGHYDYRGNIRPFNKYIEASAIVSTKGYVKVNGLFEKTSSFGTNIRSKIKVDFDRLAQENFFGIGNATTFEEEEWEDDYYFFKSVAVGGDYQARKPIYQNSDSRFDLIAGFGLEYQIPYVLLENSVFSETTPNGSKGGVIGYLNAGFVWENRDSEFDPGRGNRAAFELVFAPSWTSEYALATYSLDLRQYVRFLDLVTLAARIKGNHAAGDVPFWRLPTLGDDHTLRGYPLNRFKGSSSISYNLEMRTWVLRFPDYNIKLGGQLFTDFGRVFTRENALGDFFKDYKQTYGVGGALSIFSPDFILRGDIGFSEDVSRIYIGVGYIF